jgi:mannose-6-phosphate isomerase-like protein (cupin superfamily)
MKKLLITGFGLATMIGAQVLLAPKGEPAVYKAPHKPHTKLKEVRQKHSGKAGWRELVVDDDRLRSEYVQLEPGFKSLKMMHPDTRTWWVVLSGEVKFDIETVEPFVAKKGSMVQCPFQTWFQFETVGGQPAVIFETNIAGALTLYEKGAAPPKFPGLEWRPVRFNNRVIAKWEKKNKPHLTFDEVAADLEAGRRQGTQRIVEDARGTANFIYGYNSKLPPLDPNNKGHYHPEGAEYWLIMKGLIRYPIEKIGVVIAEEGDVVYIPRFTWHAPRWWGDGPACRLAMNGFPDIAHLFEAD